MTTVTWDFVPNQTVWVITSAGIESGVVNRAEAVATGAGETITYYIKLAGASVETPFAEADVFASCQAAEGYQIVSYGGLASLGTVAWTDAGTGSPLVYATLTANVSFSGGANIPLSVSGASLTFNNVVVALQAQVGVYGVVTLDAGNIKFANAMTGVAATVLVTDTDLFSSLTGFVRVDDAIVGDNAGAVETYANQVC